MEGRGAFEFDVFLSFASANQEAADGICRTLRQGGLRVFWAPDTLDDAMGRDFTDAIEAGLLGSRHFVLFWTAEAKESPWVTAEHKAFYTQCHIRAKGARRLVILPDGVEPTASLPLFLRNLQFARSAEEVLKRLGGGSAVREPRVSPSPRVETTRSVHPGGHPPVEAPTAPRAGTAIDGPLGTRMRFVPGGIYTIGSPESEPGRDTDETLHEVQLTRGFWLGETPVTQAQWRQLVPGPKQPSRFKDGGDDLPVESINWFEAVEFANRLSDREKLPRCYEVVKPKGSLGGGDFTCDGVTFAGLDCPGYRLPTEAEWEVAARAGVPPADGAVPDLDAVAWYRANAGGSPHPVGQKAANRWGLHDLLGNVWEWTGDWFGAYPTGRVPDPPGPPEGSRRVFRGGSWDSLAQGVRAAYRNRHDPSDRWNSLGFRLARGQSALQPKGAEPQALRPRRRGEPE